MKEEFEGKVAVITGAGSGIGLGIAEALMSLGVKVVINDFSSDLVDRFNKNTPGEAIKGDMSDLKDIEDLIDFTINKYERIDYLIANAAITHFASFLEIKPEEFDNVVGLNMRGTYFITQFAARVMKSQGEGKIILISSNLSERAYPNLAIYSMTKAAVNMMARSLSAELSPLNIRINAVAPGPIGTERTKQEVENYDEVWSNILPTNRPGTVDDIAGIVKFLLSSSADQINGQTIHVDGGWNGLGVVPIN